MVLRVLLFSVKVLQQYKEIRLHGPQLFLASTITIVPKANSYLDCCMLAVVSLFSAAQPQSQSQYFPLRIRFNWFCYTGDNE
jgi:hypothetical protein